MRRYYYSSAGSAAAAAAAAVRRSAASTTMAAGRWGTVRAGAAVDAASGSFCSSSGTPRTTRRCGSGRVFIIHPPSSSPLLPSLLSASRRLLESDCGSPLSSPSNSSSVLVPPPLPTTALGAAARRAFLDLRRPTAERKLFSAAATAASSSSGGPSSAAAAATVGGGADPRMMSPTSSRLPSVFATKQPSAPPSIHGFGGGAVSPGLVLGSSADIPIEAWKQPPTLVTRLPNGLRVASQWTPDGTITAGVWIDSGSRFERKETNGAAHFLEHMIFKGTKKRSRVQLEQEIEDIGAHLNAYTAREQTVYYAKVFRKDLPQCVDLLSDILTNSTLDEGALEVEKRVIMREMQEVEKATDEIIFDRLHMTAFRDSPLGFTILGPAENIQGMKREHLIEYITRNYTADRMVVAAAGDVDHKELVALAEKHFSKVPRAETSSVIKPLEEKPYFCGSELIFRDDSMGPIAHVAVGFEGVPWRSPDAVAFMLMQSIVGSYKKHDEGLVPGKLSGNPTIRNVANRMTVGCAEMFSAFNTCYRDTGLFGFYAQADEVAVEHCVGELMFGITSLSYSVTEEEVARAKLALKTQLFGSLDTTTAIAEDVGRQLLVYGRRIPLVEFIRRLDAIDAEEVKRVAWKYLHDTEVAVTGMGALQGMPQLIDIRRATFWMRY